MNVALRISSKRRFGVKPLKMLPMVHPTRQVKAEKIMRRIAYD